MADKAKKSTAKTVKNTSEQAYALPNGTYLPPGEEVVVNDWESQAENETVQEWIENGHLEVSDAPEPEPEPEPSPSKKSESGSSGSHSSSSGSAQTSKPKSQER
jgi:hypothetical protein